MEREFLWRLVSEKLNMTTCGEGGCAMQYMGPMGLGCGKILGGGRGSS
jgi:hypothetical protein